MRGFPVHYAWVVAVTAMLVLLGAIGLARFSFGMIIPGMAADLGLDYSQQGFLGASYFVGYMAVMVVLPWLAARIGTRRLCVGGLVVVAVSLLALSMGRGSLLLSLSYLVTGLGSGAAFIGAMSLASLWFHPSHRARAAGVTTAGAGIGILVSGLIVPRMPGLFGLLPWQTVWLCFAALCLLFAGLAMVFVRNRPSDLGLTPYGRADAGATANDSDKAKSGGGTSGRGAIGRHWPIILHLGAIYFLFAITALTYTTFIVTTMVDEFAVPKPTAGILWSVLGALSIFSGPLFGTVADRMGLRVGMASTLTVQATAFALVAFDAGPYGLYVSAVLFGLSAWSMPSIIAAAAGDYLGAEAAAAGFSVLTLMFAAGQVLGPAGAGVLAEWTGGFTSSYAVAVGLNALAVILCLFVKRR